MAYENSAGLGVVNQFGPRLVQDGGVASGGQVHGSGAVEEHVIYINGTDFTGLGYDTRLVVPKGAKFLESYIEITEAFVLGGTTPKLNVGTKGSEATNAAMALTEAQAEAVGEVFTGTGLGTYASPLAADSAVSVLISGAGATVGTAGKAKLVIRYIKI